MARKFLTNSEIREYKNNAVRAYIAATDLESSLRVLDIVGDRRELKMLIMSLRDLSEILQTQLKNYIECL